MNHIHHPFLDFDDVVHEENAVHDDGGDRGKNEVDEEDTFRADIGQFDRIDFEPDFVQVVVRNHIDLFDHSLILVDNIVDYIGYLGVLFSSSVAAFMYSFIFSWSTTSFFISAS